MDGRTGELFAAVDANGRFYRDTALGRIFHPGSVSFREISTSDSLHVAVRPGNRVSVHVDRVSPLLVRANGRCRYSFLRGVLHNLAVVGETVIGVFRGGPPRPRCQLDCEIVWVPDDEDDEQEGGEQATAAPISCPG